jgi:hypothetical protein
MSDFMFCLSFRADRSVAGFGFVKAATVRIYPIALPEIACIFTAIESRFPRGVAAPAVIACVHVFFHLNNIALREGFADLFQA